MRKLVLALVLCLLAGQQGSAEPLNGYAVFGNGNVLINSNVSGGLVGSNQNVTLGSFVTITGATGGGSFLNNLGSSTVNGPVTFNANVLTGGITYNGPINAGGNVSLGPFYQSGSITAGGNVSLSGGFSQTTGNVLAGGNFTLTTFGQVLGNVTANGSITNQGTITGTITPFAGVPVNPLTFTPTTLPPADTFTSGGPNFTGGGSLAPGSYGDVRATTFNSLTLSSGDYFFRSLTFDQSSGLNLNLAQGPINVFVTGDINKASFVNVTVNGQPAFLGGIDPFPNPAVVALAADVFFETLGNVNLGPPFGSEFFGTLFAPNGDIHVNFAPVAGSLISGGSIDVNSFSPIFYVGSNRLLSLPPFTTTVPEPGSLVLWGAGGLALAGICRWRRGIA